MEEGGVLAYGEGDFIVYYRLFIQAFISSFDEIYKKIIIPLLFCRLCRNSISSQYQNLNNILDYRCICMLYS